MRTLECSSHPPLKVRLKTTVLTTAALIGVLGAPALVRSQPLTNRIVGQPQHQRSLTITQLENDLADLVFAAAVPIGFESAPPIRKMKAVPATGRPLGEVLDAVVAADPRYEWSEDDGVIVIRPRASRQVVGPLDTQIDGVTLHDVQAADALVVLARMTGSTTPDVQGPIDAARFSVDVPAGATFLDLLNAIVRAHGKLLWKLTYNTSIGSDKFPMFIGLDRYALGIRAGAVVSTAPRSVSSTAPDGPVMDRMVGPRRNGRAVVMRSFRDIAELASAVGAPVGIELLPRGALPSAVPSSDGVTMTGLPMRDALWALRGMDPRYEYRELDGVVVVRPSEAWNDQGSLLSMPVQNISLENATADAAISLILNLLGLPRRTSSDFPDTRRFSLRLPSGTMFDLLNAFVRAHGSISWQFQHNNEEEQRSEKSRYSLIFTLTAGIGMGYPIP